MKKVEGNVTGRGRLHWWIRERNWRERKRKEKIFTKKLKKNSLRERERERKGEGKVVPRYFAYETI